MTLLPITLPIPSYPDYVISPDGLMIINLRTGNRIKTFLRSGYPYVCMYKGWNKQPVAVKYLVAETYLKEEPKEFVWVLDGLKENNHYSNLMFHETRQLLMDSNIIRKPRKKSARSERARKSKLIQGEMNPRYVGRYIINGKVYHSAHKAGLDFGITAKSVIERCKSRTGAFRGFKFVEKK